MPKKRYAPEEIISMLREADVCRQLANLVESDFEKPIDNFPRPQITDHEIISLGF